MPAADRNRLDWGIAQEFSCISTLPHNIRDIADIVQEIDIIWLEKGSSRINALFEVEHSTPIYSGLLRFNDICIVLGRNNISFNIVAIDERRDLFVRQLNRPTFSASGLNEVCSFLTYKDAFLWHNRIHKDTSGELLRLQ